MDRSVYPKWGIRVPAQVTGKEMIHWMKSTPVRSPKMPWGWNKSWKCLIQSGPGDEHIQLNPDFQGSQIGEFEFCQWIWFLFSGHLGFQVGYQVGFKWDINRAWDLMGFQVGYLGFPIMLGLGFDDLIDLHVVFHFKSIWKFSVPFLSVTFNVRMKTGNYNSSDFGEPFSSMKQWQQMNLPCFTFKIPQWNSRRFQIFHSIWGVLSFPELNKSVMMAEKEAESLRTAFEAKSCQRCSPQVASSFFGCWWRNLPGDCPRILLQELAALAGLCVCFVAGLF